MSKPDATVLGSIAKPLSLRICGGPRDGQVIRLTSRKCTIGSADNCTLRLHARGVRPVHCLILRGPSETLLRRWSADTLLNGRAFTDAILAPGDRVRCGPVEFEWMEDPTEGVNMRSVTQVMDPPATADRLAPVPDPQWLNEQRRSLEQEKLQWRRQRQREEESLQQQREQVELLLTKQLARVRATDPSARSSPYVQAASETTMNRNATEVITQPISPRASGAEARVVALEEELARLLEELDQVRDDGAAKQASFEEQFAALQQLTSDETSRISARTAELDRQAHELDAARQQIEAQFARLQQAQADLTTRQAAWAAEQKAAQDAWDARIAEFERRTADLVHREAELEAADSRGEADEAQPSGSERLATMRYLDESDDETDSKADLAPTVGISASSSSHDDNEDQSIEQYMSALLHRVGGHSAAAAPATTATIVCPQPPKDESIDTNRPERIETRFVERGPRKAAPENTDTMAAMRELANLSTRVALDRHGKARLLAAAWVKAMVAAAAFGTSVWLAQCVRGPTLLGPNAVALTFIIGAAYALSFAQTMRQRRHSKRSIQTLLAQTASSLVPAGESQPGSTAGTAT